MQKLKLIGRNSRLSQLQIELVRKKIQFLFPEIRIEVITRMSRGDVLQGIPLHKEEGRDFFTQEISDALVRGEADIAVHSLKDMSSEHFFGTNRFAVVDREDPRDLAIFNSDVEERIRRGERIRIGTCSPRREEMAVQFLKKALPSLGGDIKVETRSIRGNVETRLRKLHSGDYDGTILAAAGLNRLLSDQKHAPLLSDLLKDKKLMLLPLIDCVPAPGQGAVVAETIPSNSLAVEIVQAINDQELFKTCCEEKKEATQYGTGCIQKFGVTTIRTKKTKYLFAAGKDKEGAEFVRWSPLPDLHVGKIFSATEVMKDFFGYDQTGHDIPEKAVVFVANYRAIQFAAPDELRKKKILVSGTRTWLALARLGYWVTASADGLGFESLIPSLGMPLFGIRKEDLVILTHAGAAERWRGKGYHATGTYHLRPKNKETILQSIGDAKAIFWSSYSQFEYYGKYVKPGAVHLCPGGETSELLALHGLKPVIFPTIKSFEQWRKSSTRPRSVA